MEALREQRENTITTTREELYSAQEEILMLRHAMESATAEREREITALQGDLSAVTAELDKWRQTAANYEVEIGNMQASFQLQNQHQEKASQLQGIDLDSHCAQKHRKPWDSSAVTCFNDQGNSQR